MTISLGNRRQCDKGSRSTIGSGPVDPPTLAGCSHPEQAFHRSAACVVVERSSTLVKAACVPRLGPPETLAVEVMAKLVAEGAQERAEGGDLFPDGGPHPQTDDHRFGIVVAEQLDRTAFADSKRAGSKYSDHGPTNLEETRCNRSKLCTCLSNGRGSAALHGGSDKLGRRLQPVVLWDFQRCEPVALKESCP